MRHWKAALVVASAVAIFHAAPAQAHYRGVVFLHGTSDHTGSYTCSGSGNEYKCTNSSAVGYWTQGFIDSVRYGPDDGWNRPYAVLGCRLASRRPWNYGSETGTAYCAGDQIDKFLNGPDQVKGTSDDIQQIVIVTHSGGGNVIRYMLQQYASNSKWSRIRSVTAKFLALAAPFRGTYLANWVFSSGIAKFINGVIEFFGGSGLYNDDGTKFIRTTEMSSYNYDSAKFSAMYNPINGITVRAGWGTYPNASIWRSASWCGGYHISLGLNLLHRLYLDSYDSSTYRSNCSDGFIPCQSAGALTSGSNIMFGGFSKSDEKYKNHNQTRRKCRSVNTTVRNQVDADFNYVHAEVVDDMADIPAAKRDACEFSVTDTIGGCSGPGCYTAGCPTSFLGDGFCDASCLSVYGRDAVPTFGANGNITAWGADDCTADSHGSEWSASFDGKKQNGSSTVYVSEYVDTYNGYDDSSYCPEDWLDDGVCDECHLVKSGSDGNDCRPSTGLLCNGITYDYWPWYTGTKVYNQPNTVWGIVNDSCGDGICTPGECDGSGGTTCSSDCTHATADNGTVNLCD